MSSKLEKNGLGFNIRLKKTRKKCGIKRSEMAEKCGVGESTYYRWESGVTEPGASLLVKICRILDCDLDWLVRGAEKEKTPELSVEELKNLVAWQQTKIVELEEKIRYYDGSDVDVMDVLEKIAKMKSEGNYPEKKQSRGA